MPVARFRFAALCLTGLMVWVFLSRVVSSEDIFFAASAVAPGAGGSQFVHEMEVHNPTGAQATFELSWLPRGQDNSNPTTVEVTVDPARSTRFGNVLFEVFGLDGVAIGALRARTANDELLFHSRVVMVSEAETLGQIIPAAPETTGFGGGEAAYILGLLEDDDFRSNIWCANTTDLPILVNAQLIGIDGDQVDVITIPMEPLSNAQVNRIFQGFAPIEGYVRLWTPTPGGRAICDGVVIGNLSNDPGTERGANGTTADTEFYLPYVEESATRSGTVDLFAPDGDVVVTIELLPTGTDNTTPASYDFVIGDQHVGRIDHVLANLFAYQGTGALRMSTSGGLLMVSSRTLDSTPTGPVSWWVQSVPTSEQFVRSDSVSLIHLRESDDFQTDIGFVNTSSINLDLEITLHGETGDVLGTIPVQLLPYSHGQIDGVFASEGHPSVPVGFATVTSSTHGGSYMAYAIVTDLNTGDAYHVPGQRTPPALFKDGFESGDTTRWLVSVP